MIPDERLELIFACCHPALAADAQVALTLSLVGGLTTPEIARAFIVPEPTLAQRLVRAKRKIREAESRCGFLPSTCCRSAADGARDDLTSSSTRRTTSSRRRGSRRCRRRRVT